MSRTTEVERGVWNPIFARPLHDWELEEVQRFLCLLDNRTLKPEVKNKLYWKGDRKGLYTISLQIEKGNSLENALE